MSNKERWLAVAMVAVIALILGARPLLIALGILVPYQVEVQQGPDPIVLTTPLYGAEQVLKQLGFETGRWEPGSTPLAAGETLILPGQDLSLTLQQVDALIESVRGGAHLVVLVPWNAVGLSENPKLPIARLLSAFGVIAVSSIAFDEQPEEELPTEQAEQAPAESDRVAPEFVQGGAHCPRPEPLPREIPDATKLPRTGTYATLHPPLVPSRVPFEVSWGRMALQTSAPPDCWVGLVTDDGTVLYQLLQNTVGLGRVTVIASARAFDNVFLSLEGRAHLLAGLARQTGFEGRVWFPARFSRPTIWSILAPLGWPFVITIGGALLAWIWAYGVRFGPILASEPTSRRRLAEHIEATGRWAWRHRLSDALISHTRRVALERLFLRHPRWRSLNQPQLEKELAELTQLSPKTIEQGFYGSLHADASHFVSAITLWERIRKRR